MGDKRAEIEFLRRSGSLDWELRKPFSPPRQWTCPNSIDLIEKFVVGMRQLNACPEDTILDLGAGACWASEWLQGLNIRTISLDISVDAIRAGRDRVHDKSLLVVGDMASLPLRDAVCTKVLSLDALHHSQDVARSVREVHRVLKPGGCAVFVEPGMGHSDAPETRTSIDDFGLTERSIQINEMFELCATAGFAEVRLKPISYIIPEFEMTQQDWIHWERFWMRKRPVRAIQKIGRAIVEMIGFAKKTLLLEETFAVDLLRLFKNPVQCHPVLAAWKAHRPKGDQRIYSAVIKCELGPDHGSPGEQAVFVLTLKNSSNWVWTESHAGCMGGVAIGVQLLDDQKRMLEKDYFRHCLRQPVAPGQATRIEVRLALPKERGVYFLKFDLLEQGISWFQQRGSSVAIRQLRIG